MKLVFKWSSVIILMDCEQTKVCSQLQLPANPESLFNHNLQGFTEQTLVQLSSQQRVRAKTVLYCIQLITSYLTTQNTLGVKFKDYKILLNLLIQPTKQHNCPIHDCFVFNATNVLSFSMLMLTGVHVCTHKERRHPTQLCLFCSNMTGVCVNVYNRSVTHTYLQLV